MLSLTGIKDSGSGRHKRRMLPHLLILKLCWVMLLVSQHQRSSSLQPHFNKSDHCFFLFFLFRVVPCDLAASLCTAPRSNRRERSPSPAPHSTLQPLSAHRAPRAPSTTSPIHPRPPAAAPTNNVRALPSRPARIHPLARHRLAARLARAPAMVARNLRQALEPSQPAPAAAPAAATHLAAQRRRRVHAATTADELAGSRTAVVGRARGVQRVLWPGEGGAE